MNSGWLIVISIFLVLAGVALISMVVDNHRFVVREYTIRTPKVRDDLTFVFVTDLHGKDYGNGNAALLAAVDAAHPDAVLVGGDMIISRRARENRPGWIDTAQNFLQAVAAKYPVYMADGNHEEYLLDMDGFADQYEAWCRMAREAGVVKLHNAFVDFPVKRWDKRSRDKKEERKRNGESGASEIATWSGVRIYGLDLDRDSYQKVIPYGLPEKAVEELLGPGAAGGPGREPEAGGGTGREPGAAGDTGREPEAGGGTGREPEAGGGTGREPEAAGGTGREPEAAGGTGREPEAAGGTGRGSCSVSYSQPLGMQNPRIGNESGVASIQETQGPDGAGKDCFRLVLAHNPKYFEAYAEWGADLVLSGHVHGGLLRIGGHGFIGPDLHLFPKYSGGMYELKVRCDEDVPNRSSASAVSKASSRISSKASSRASSRAPSKTSSRASSKVSSRTSSDDIAGAFRTSRMIVSCGLGSHTLPIRIFNPGELTVVHLVHSDEGN